MSRLVIALLSGVALAIGIAACGEDREGAVTVEGGATTSTGSTGGTGTTPTTPATTGTTGTTETGGTPDQTVTVTADPGGELAWTEDEITVRSGVVRFVMENGSGVPHALEVEGMGVEEESETIQDGTTEVTVNLEKPGEYVFYCPVGNHEQAGMKGTLIVE